MRPQPGGHGWAWSDAHVRVVTIARKMIARECYAEKAKAGPFTSSAGADQWPRLDRFASSDV
jgi:hypothetical protein